MSGRSPPLYCTLIILITLHSHQSYPNIPTVVHSYEDSTNIDYSIIEPYKNRGLGKQKNVGGEKTHQYTVQYHQLNCPARISHKHRIHGKLGLQLRLKKNQNAPRPSEFVTVWVTRTHRYWDCHLVEGVWYIYDWDTRSSILP